MSLSLFINIDQRNSLETISRQLKFIKWVPAAVCCLGLRAIHSFGCKRLSRQGNNCRTCKKSHWKGRRATLTTAEENWSSQLDSPHVRNAGSHGQIQPAASPASRDSCSPQDQGSQTGVSAHSPGTARLKHTEIHLSSYISTHSVPAAEKRNWNNHSPLTRTLFCHGESALLRKAPIWSCSITHRGICYTECWKVRGFYIQTER